MKISIVCAFEDEIKLLTGKMSEVKSSIMCGIPITSGKIGGHEINLCIGGIGKSNAAATTQFNISALGCDALLNIGLAGNCSSLPLGGAVVASKLVYHDYNMEWARESAPFVTYFTPDKRLVAARRSGMDGVRQELFPGPGLAQQEHRGVKLRRAPRPALDLHARRTRADEIGEGVFRAPCFG